MSAAGGKRVVRLGLFGLLLVSPGFAQAPGLRARLGAASRTEMEVFGVDESGVRLRPVDTSMGEVILPLKETRDLNFVLSDDYQRAQQLAFNGRPDEALVLLNPLVTPLLPYVAAPGSNAVPITNYYFDLLLGQAQWDEAVELVRRLPLDVPGLGFVPKVVRLGRALRATGRAMDASVLVGRIPTTAATAPWFPLLGEFADELRRNGNYVEARTLYERLRPFAVGAAQVERTLLIAYTDFHTGGVATAAALMETISEPEEQDEALTLYRLLRGRLALEAGRWDEALDELGRGLVGAPGASEWRAELQSVAAAAYRTAGQTEVAATMEADMRSIFPESRWTPST